ncbi:unnamed protein product, partial [Amoebophrya sp. A120]|eukprot:GSA120T00013646001.1
MSGRFRDLSCSFISKSKLPHVWNAGPSIFTGSSATPWRRCRCHLFCMSNALSACWPEDGTFCTSCITDLCEIRNTHHKFGSFQTHSTCLQLIVHLVFRGGKEGVSGPRG